jgi:hypothetical protein
MSKITEVEGRWWAFIVMGVMVRRQMADPNLSKHATYAKAFLESDRARWSDAPVRHADGLQIMGISEAAIRDFYTPGDWDLVCDAIDAHAQIEIAILEEREEVRRAQEKRAREEAEDWAAAGDGPLRRAFFEGLQYRRQCFPNGVPDSGRRRRT